MSDKFILYLINVRGEQDYGALDFKDEIGIKGAITRYLSLEDSETSYSESDESEKSYTYYVNEYSFMSKVDMENAIRIFDNVHSFIDYDNSKHSDIFMITKEEYIEMQRI